MKKKLLVSLLLSAGLLGGCASSTDSELYERLADLEEARIEMQETYEEREQKKREEEIALLPEWVLEPPVADATGMYGVGIAESKKVGHGLKLARLNAEFALAKNYRQELSGSERAFEEGDSEGNVLSQSTFLIDKLVDSVPVVGVEVVEQIVTPNRGINNVYVLLKLPYDEFNKVLQQQKAKTLDKKVQASFDDLERRLDKRRAQRLTDEQVEFERKQKEMKVRSELLKQNDDKPVVVNDSVLGFNR